MTYEIRLFEKNRKPVIQKFTDYGNGFRSPCSRYINPKHFDRFQLLARHFYGIESTRDYGYGKGYEPIMVGSL